MRKLRIKIKSSLTEEKQLLNEITYASAVNNLLSKKMLKAVRRWSEENLGSYKPLQSMRSAEEMAAIDLRRAKTMRDWLLDLIPDDITDNQKGLAVTWLARLTRNLETGYMTTFIDGADPGPSDSWGSFEMFFQYQQFMSERDLNKIEDLQELQEIVNEARPRIEAYQEKRVYHDASEGTVVFRDDDKWYIAAIHNKGAACELGKGTDWCTAAPGLDYFEEYYDPDDPLFFFKHHTGSRMQFHYGSEQFMDRHDVPLPEDVMIATHKLLMQTDAVKKYPILQKYNRKVVLADEDTSSEKLAEMANEPNTGYLEFLKIAKHPNTDPETLRKLIYVDGRHRNYLRFSDMEDDAFMRLPDVEVDKMGDVNKYAVSIKAAIAENASSPQILEELWEKTWKDYQTHLKDVDEKLRRTAEKAYSDNWYKTVASRYFQQVRDFFVPAWEGIAVNPASPDSIVEDMTEKLLTETPSRYEPDWLVFAKRKRKLLSEPPELDPYVREAEQKPKVQESKVLRHWKKIVF
jgi:hypothetical protein